MKHKHAELIKAWADGAKIQGKSEYVDWKDLRHPTWDENWQYRIKPEPKPDVFRNITVAATLFHGEPFVQVFRSGEYVFPNLRLTFDGETGELKSAEVLR